MLGQIEVSNEKEVFDPSTHFLAAPSTEKEVADARVRSWERSRRDDKEAVDSSIYFLSGPPSSTGRSERSPARSEDAPEPVQEKPAKHGLWVPFFLRRPVLFAFVAFALAILTAAEVLNARSTRDNGLAAAKPSLHYLWTFGPTAVLTILAAFWNQVDYQIRRNAPFVRMTRAKLPAQESVLLDYLSPWDPQALLSGMNKKDWQVTLSVLGSLTIRLLIVLSTGLFSLRYPSVAVPASVLTRDAFDLTRNTIANTTERGQITSNALVPPIFNLTYSEGTNARYATQSFGLLDSDLQANTTLEGDVNVFSGDLECERAEWDYSNRSQRYTNSFGGSMVDLDFWSDNYAINGLNFSSAGLAGPEDDWDMSKKPLVDSETGVGWIASYGLASVTCVVSRTGSTQPCYLVAFGYSNLVDTSVPEGNSIPAPTITNKAQNPTLPTATSSLGRRQVMNTPGGQSTTPFMVTIKNMTALLCRPKLSYARAQVSCQAGQSSTAGGVNVTRILEEVPLPASLDAWEFAEQVRIAAKSNLPILSSLTISSTEFFGLTDLIARRASYYEYLDPAILTSATRETFQRLVAQYAKQQLTTPQETKAQGRTFNTGPRLVVETLTLRLMDIFLVVFALCALFLCLFFGFPGLPRDFSSVGAVALLLSQSPDLARLCSGLGSARLKDMVAWMRGYRFYCSRDSQDPQRSYQIKAELDPSIPVPDYAQLPKRTLKWWRPAMFNTPWRIPTVLLPLILVAALEAGLRYSTNHTGYGLVPKDGYMKYAWTFGPAVVMVAIAATFGVLDFATRTFQVYHSLSAARGSAAQDLVETPFGYFAFVSLIRSISRRQWALSTTSLAICLSPLLTVVVSGLLQAESVGIQVLGDANIADTFVTKSTARFDWNQDESNAVLGMRLYANVSFPQYTYNNMVFPNFTLVANSSMPQPTRFNVTVPAAMISSNCAVLDPSTYSWGSSSEGDNSTTQSILGRVKMPNDCIVQNKTTRRNDTITMLDFQIDYIPKSAGPAYGIEVEVDNSTTCGGEPYGYLYGLVRNRASTVQAVNMIRCKPSINIVTVNASVRALDSHISNAEVITDGAPAERFFTNDYSIFRSAQYPCRDKIALWAEPTNCAPDVLTQSPIFNLTESDVFSLAESTRVSKAYTKLMDMTFAQRFSYYFRAPLQSSPSSAVFLPTTTKLKVSILDQAEYRVVQSRISTRILQSLLGVMALCAVIAWSCTRSNKVLTKNPQSIAAVASLLVDSSMVKDIPVGAESMSNDELKANGVFEGRTFSIGWWGQGNARRFGIDEGVAEKPV
ncbi:Hypothetical protein D9617_5g068520 [Elsinoe fawcettii]|nr:Hypothetical protein D9617_5g068520 [Elsinoe fawcettii]